MKSKSIILLLLISLPIILFGQGRAGVWYFGKNAGLDFGTDPPQALNNGVLHTQEGCATVCSPQGDLLFYTDGISVFNKNHQQMENGDGLNGHSSATQSSVIVQKPENSFVYYIFTVDAHQNGFANGFNYSIVDLSKKNGLGAVIDKNIPLLTDQVCEKVTAVRHSNGTDYWIIVHLFNNSEFKSFLLSSSGIGMEKTSTIGNAHNSGIHSAIGYMKTNHVGDQIAVAIYNKNLVELFEFDNSTGLLSNPIQIKGINTPYGIEFSPSGELLYISSFGHRKLYQYNLSSNVETTINASQQIIGSSSIYYFGALQLGPNNKIYLAKYKSSTVGTTNLDVIHSPDQLGVGCDYRADDQYLGGREALLGLPNFVTSLFSLDFTYQPDCVGDHTKFSILSDLSSIREAHWDFGDGTSQSTTVSPFALTHQYTSTGTYTVHLRVDLTSGGSDEIQKEIKIKSEPVVFDQVLTVDEDVPGGGESNQDLTVLETVINSDNNAVFLWYSDISLSSMLPDPTNVNVRDGDRFWAEVIVGNCSNVAEVEFIVESTIYNVNFRAENFCVDSPTNFEITSDLSIITEARWDFGDGATQVVDVSPFSVHHIYSSAGDKTVSLTVELISGTSRSSTKQITINQPVANDLDIHLVEDSPGSGQAIGIDLSIYQQQINSNTAYGFTWYTDVALSTQLSNINNVSINDQDEFWVEVSDGICSNVCRVLFTIDPLPFLLDFTSSNHCFGERTELNITTDIENITQATWFFGDGVSQVVSSSPFSLSYVYGSYGDYEVRLKVILRSGRVVEQLQNIQIYDFPTALSQHIDLWEDTQGSGLASNVDLTSYENQINLNDHFTFIWFEDEALTHQVVNPMNIDVRNGQQFWVQISNYNCVDIAKISFTVHSLPVAKDLMISVCEDSYQTGLSLQNLISYEDQITDNPTNVITWFHDPILKKSVVNPQQIWVSNNQKFYVNVTAFGQSSIATVVFKISELPLGKQIDVDVWEDSFASGIASNVNLNLYADQVGAGNVIVWYDDFLLQNRVVNPESVIVRDNDVFYAEVSNENCINKGSVTFQVRSSVVANNLQIDLCEDHYESGQMTSYDLSQLNASVNGGTVSTVSWFHDAAHMVAVSNSKSVTVTDQQIYYTLVSYNSEVNSSEVLFRILSQPLAVNISVIDFEDEDGSGIARQVDLTLQHSKITENTNTLLWFLNQDLTIPVPNPKAHDVADGDVFYVSVSNGQCENTARVAYEILDTPTAHNIFPELCESAEGSGEQIVDLTIYEGEINESNGDLILWFYDWPDEPEGLPVHPIPDPSNVNVSDKRRLFATVSDALYTNVAVAEFSIRDLPEATDQLIEVWEDSFGLGISTEVNLEVYHDLINSTSNAIITWYSDENLLYEVLTPRNIDVVTGDTYYALVQDDLCENSAVVRFLVKALPKANDLSINLCEDDFESLLVRNYNLRSLDHSVGDDPKTVKEWFYDEHLNLPVSQPTSTVIHHGDVFYVKVSIEREYNVAEVDFTILSKPDARDQSDHFCESSYGSGTFNFLNLTTYESEITSDEDNVVIWYKDENYLVNVDNPQSVSVQNQDVFYARIWNGNCENYARLSVRIHALPPSISKTDTMCEDSYLDDVVAAVDLTSYEDDLFMNESYVYQWYYDDQLTILVENPKNITVSNQTTCYAKISNENTCENKCRLNFIVKSMPEANNLFKESCETEAGSLMVRNCNLEAFNDEVSSNEQAVIRWCEDSGTNIEVKNSFKYNVTDGKTLYVEVEDQGCINHARVDFQVNATPVFDLGKDTTIYYTETKVLAPSIDLKFLPGQYLWQDGSTSSTYMVNEAGEYALQFTDINGCVGYDEIRVKVDRYRIFVPNAFTPNGDGLNDIFGPSITGDIAGQDIEMFIYNRWGELIYEFSDFGKGWDGSYKGNPAVSGSYVWVLIINDKAKQDGTVTLIR